MWGLHHTNTNENIQAILKKYKKLDEKIDRQRQGVRKERISAQKDAWRKCLAKRQEQNIQMKL